LRNEPYGSALADSKPSARSRQIAFWYAIGASAAAISTLLLMRWSAAFALCTGWIALATACVAWAYWRGGPYAFQKNDRGQIPLAVRLLLAPVIAGAFVNSRIWTRTQPDAVKVAPGVYVGRTPTNRDIRRHRYAANLDLTAEMPRWTRDDASFAYVCVPQLDLVPSSLSCLHEAVHALDRLHREHGDVLVSCALGLGRSVRCVAGWIAMKEGLSDAREAILMVRRAQPRAVCSEESVALLQTWIDSTRALEV
jgi:protein-tyrosine phosphatase